MKRLLTNLVGGPGGLVRVVVKAVLMFTVAVIGLAEATGGDAMIELRMTAGDFTQLRFAYSPVDEAIGSLHMLHSGQVHPLHQG